MRSELQTLAVALAKAWKTFEPVADPVGDQRPRSREEAYQVQDRMAQLIGGRIGGWKVGAALRAVQITEGHDGPIPGRLFAERIHVGSATLPARDYAGYKAEVEYAFRLTRDLEKRAEPWSRGELVEAMDFVPGIEIAGSRLKGDTAGIRTLLAIADNGAGGAFVFGEPISDWQRIDFDGMALEAGLPGTSAEIYRGEQRGDVVDVAVEMVDAILSRGATLAKGDYLSTGSLSWPLALRPGETFTARFGDIETLSVTLD